MRLIPGKTKVQIELFKGITLTDIIIGFVAALLVGFVLTSALPGQIFIIGVIVVITALLLLRLDSEPNYIFVLHVLTHLVMHHHYKRTSTDRMILNEDEAQQEVSLADAGKALTEEEKKQKRLEEKEEYRRDQKILRDKNTTKSEADAIWLKRAKQSAERKAERRAGKQIKYTDMAELVGFTGINDGYIEYDGQYYGLVIEIPPVEFRFFSDMRRNNSIENGIGRILRVLPPQYSANIVKLERPILYDSYIELEKAKVDELRKAYEEGFITEEEFMSRTEILAGRMNELNDICFNQKVVQPYYYIVLYDSDKTQLNNAYLTAMENLTLGEMQGRRLNDKELAVFLKYSNQIDFDERDIEKVPHEKYAEWAMPESVIIGHKTVTVNGIVSHTMRLVNYQSLVGDAWMAHVMSMPSTKVVVKCRPLDKSRSITVIDRSLQELRVQFYSTTVDSKRIEYQTHIESLSALLAMLQSDSESLLEVNVYVTAYDINVTREQMGEAGDSLQSCYIPVNELKKAVRRTYQEVGMRLNNMDFDQTSGFLGSQITAWDPMRNNGRGMPSNTVAAMYPWIYAHVKDQNGVKLGKAESAPVFVDFYRRDSERVNSNLVILGKSGSGKSFATKTILANLAADDSKIFILDPENEYSELAHNLHGKFINVGNAQHGRLNPFHIITALDDDEADAEAETGSSYATHLQFLEEFMRQILPDCDKDAMEYLNSLIDRVYLNKGITDKTDLSQLRPEDYPTFDDLYDAILSEFQSSDNEFIKTMLRTLMNYIQKFASGGRNAAIWNGPSSVTTDENFTVFNFQSLLANRNNTVANAQMLLVLKYIDNEIIKNRDYNLKYGLHRKVIVVIDEAHVFIDTKFPVALDFMYQLAKRIRKYNGMQIVITQNIKDFVGSEEIARKSTAIINACQYSFIFSLAPNDMDDLCKLYDKSGGINENEQDQIVNAPRGQVFAIMSPHSRTTFDVEASHEIVDMFRDPNRVSAYFNGESGQKEWENFLGDSKEKRVTDRFADRYAVSDRSRDERSRVTFIEEPDANWAARRAAEAPTAVAPVDGSPIPFGWDLSGGVTPPAPISAPAMNIESTPASVDGSAWNLTGSAALGVAGGFAVTAATAVAQAVRPSVTDEYADGETDGVLSADFADAGDASDDLFDGFSDVVDTVDDMDDMDGGAFTVPQPITEAEDAEDTFLADLDETGEIADEMFDGLFTEEADSFDDDDADFFAALDAGDGDPDVFDGVSDESDGSDEIFTDLQDDMADLEELGVDVQSQEELDDLLSADSDDEGELGDVPLSELLNAEDAFDEDADVSSLLDDDFDEDEDSGDGELLPADVSLSELLREDDLSQGGGLDLSNLLEGDELADAAFADMADDMSLADLFEDDEAGESDESMADMFDDTSLADLFEDDDDEPADAGRSIADTLLRNAPPVTIPEGTAESQTVAILGQLLNQFRYDAMVEEIRRTVKEALGSEPAGANRNRRGASEDEDDDLDFDSLLDLDSDEDDDLLGDIFGLSDEEGDGDSMLLGDIFDLGEDEESAGGQPQTQTQGQPQGQPLGNIFAAAAEAGASFDVSQNMSANAEQGEQVSAIERMDEMNEKVIEITLEDLVIYNKNQLKAKKSA